MDLPSRPNEITPGLACCFQPLLLDMRSKGDNAEQTPVCRSKTDDMFGGKRKRFQIEHNPVRLMDLRGVSCRVKSGHLLTSLMGLFTGGNQTGCRHQIRGEDDHGNRLGWSHMSRLPLNSARADFIAADLDGLINRHHPDFSIT
jgi:hypothetical protein